VALIAVWPCAGYGQAFVYVNTDNLLLRDRPQKTYEVLAVLHAPCKLKVEAYEDGYKHNADIKSRFYQVAINYYDARKIYHHIGGWVDKRYVVAAPGQLTTAVADTDLDLHISVVKMIPSGADDAHNPNGLNWADYGGPTYKGGVAVPAGVQRKYRKGPKGGCYYLNGKGRKVYVAKRFCDGKE